MKVYVYEDGLTHELGFYTKNVNNSPYTREFDLHLNRPVNTDKNMSEKPLALQYSVEGIKAEMSKGSDYPMAGFPYEMAMYLLNEIENRDLTLGASMREIRQYQEQIEQLKKNER